MRTWLRWLVLAVLLAGFGAFYAFGWNGYFDFDNVKENLGSFKSQVDDNLVLAVIVFFVLYAVLTALSVPAAWILTLLAGALFGRFLGAGVALLAATIGATLAFLSSRFLLGNWVQAKLGNRLEAFNRGIEKDGAYYLFSLRLVPLFPFFLINLGMGLTSIRTWTFFWVSLVGMLPGAFLYANAGAELQSLQSPQDILSPVFLVSLALLGIAPLAFRKAVQWMGR
jgi:uncharacterized membrane protein YdjX (TVP38/TMEM64 family)